MPATTCPNCRTIRAPNAAYCHVCGHLYDPSRAAQVEPWVGPPVQVTEHRMSFTTAVTIGAGLAVGALLVGLVGTVISALIFGSLLNTMLRSIPGFGA
jgi:hypothetical protein